MKRIKVQVLFLAALAVLVSMIAGCSADGGSSSMTNADLYDEFTGTVTDMLTKAANADGTMKDQVSGDNSGFVQFTTGMGGPVSMYFENYSDDGEFIFSGTLTTPSGEANDLFWYSLGTAYSGETILEGTIELTGTYAGCTIKAEGTQLKLSIAINPEDGNFYMTIEGEMTVQSMDEGTSESFLFQAAGIRI